MLGTFFPSIVSRASIEFTLILLELRLTVYLKVPDPSIFIDRSSMISIHEPKRNKRGRVIISKRRIRYFFIKTKLDLLKINLKHEYNSGKIDSQLLDFLNREIDTVTSKILYDGNNSVEISSKYIDVEAVNFNLDYIDNIIKETKIKLYNYDRK